MSKIQLSCKCNGLTYENGEVVQGGKKKKKYPDNKTFLDGEAWCYVDKKFPEGTSDPSDKYEGCGLGGDAPKTVWDNDAKMFASAVAKDAGLETWALILIILGSIIGALILGYLLYMYMM